MDSLPGNVLPGTTARSLSKNLSIVMDASALKLESLYKFLETALVPAAAQDAAHNRRGDHQCHKTRAKEKISHFRAPLRQSSSKRVADRRRINLQEG